MEYSSCQEVILPTIWLHRLGTFRFILKEVAQTIFAQQYAASYGAYLLEILAQF